MRAKGESWFGRKFQLGIFNKKKELKKESAEQVGWESCKA